MPANVPHEGETSLEHGSPDEGFLGRWSRRKREAAMEPVRSAETGDTDTAPSTPKPLPDLPDIETLGPASDYSVFLREGVPAELRRLALRAAWARDPAIANFRGFADYDWDFNAPGYGWLSASAEEVAALAARVLPAPRAPTDPSGEPPGELPGAPDLDEA